MREIGKYYGVVRISSPTYVIASFGSKDEADAYANKIGPGYYVIEY